MNEQEYPIAPSDCDKLRDRMFQQRLWIEQLRRTGNWALKNAVNDLKRMTGAAQKAEELGSKRRPK